ncbi:FAD-dependent tricarballylate dehydrogenase TcuA [Poriferisphaera sp. WC338]|uniref:FAD-dependent tricarballylate dehydrogenase TcuA n=1 Tax=Poriferisphaera sp. WC338 TaxID=3425129 RepID=UPI003D81A912
MANIKNKVIVLGSGNAALCAAMSAADAGADVTILEKSSEAEMGGNTRLTTAALRVVFENDHKVREILDEQYSDEQWSNIEIEPYDHQKYVAEVMKSGKDRPDQELVKWFTSESLDIIHWMKVRGVKFELAEYLSEYDLTKGESEEKRKYAGGVIIQVVQGGQGMVTPELKYAQDKGAKIVYEMPGVDLITNDKGHVQGVIARDAQGDLHHYDGAVVIGSGGFEANSAMRAQYLGPEWCDVRQRCVKFNTGEMIVAAINAGAGQKGHWSGAHITPIDPDSPFVGGLDTKEKTNRLGFSWGVTVNKDGHRFIDEGKHWNNQIYVEMGKALLYQPGQVGYQIFDARGVKYCEPNYELQKQFYTGDKLEKLAQKAGINPDTMMQTIEAYNKAVKKNDGGYDPTTLDGKKTKGLPIPKTNWALPIKKAPFYIYPVVPGVTFTFGGLASNTKCEILDAAGHSIPGLYGCGEATGGYFYYAYPTGSGLIKGSVTGRCAGRHAAAYAVAH